MKLQPTQAASGAPDGQRSPEGGGHGPAHAERVTLSDEARETSRHAPPPPVGNVRWYRAPRYGAASAPPPAAAGAPARRTHLAVQAYQRQLSAVDL